MSHSIAVMTDTNSGLTPEQAKELGVYLLPMPILINGKEYYEHQTITPKEFYKEMQEKADISTAQPSPADLMDLWEEILKTHDEIVHIPMSSGLSGSCETAAGFAKEFDGRVLVVDNHRISVTMRQSVLEALQMAREGKTGTEIKEYLEKDGLESSIYIAVNTLEYLKKGGRITAAAAAVGSVLNIKPVLQIQGGKLDAYKKVRGMKAAMKAIIDGLKQDETVRFKGQKLLIRAAYSGDDSVGEMWQAELQKAFPEYTIEKDPLPLSIACHTGADALGVGIMKDIL